MKAETNNIHIKLYILYRKAIYPLKSIIIMWDIIGRKQNMISGSDY